MERGVWCASEGCMARLLKPLLKPLLGRAEAACIRRCCRCSSEKFELQRACSRIWKTTLGSVLALRAVAMVGDVVLEAGTKQTAMISNGAE